MEVVGDLNIVHLFSSLLLGSIGVAAFFFRTTNSLDKRITKLETQIDVGKNTFKRMERTMDEMNSNINKMSSQLNSLIAVLKSKNIINGDYKAPENTWYNHHKH